MAVRTKSSGGGGVDAAEEGVAAVADAGDGGDEGDGTAPEGATKGGGIGGRCCGWGAGAAAEKQRCNNRGGEAAAAAIRNGGVRDVVRKADNPRKEVREDTSAVAPPRPRARARLN